jgi:hypothetical protein
MKKKRGQAAMEYLMTYGWALIILVAVLSVLFSMGVFNPQNYMSEECSFQPSLPCRGASLSPDGVLKIYMTNGLGYEVDSWDIEVEGQKGSSSQQSDGTIIFTVSDLGNYKPYDVYKFKPQITYYIDGKPYKISGTVTVRASE